jgi:uncharacterized protein YneF (UPF0154 family)
MYVGIAVGVVIFLAVIAGVIVGVLYTNGFFKRKVNSFFKSHFLT